MLRRIPLRGRLFLALATVALLPVIVFGGLTVAQVGGTVQAGQDRALVAMARLCADDLALGQTLEPGTARRLAALTGSRVTLFSPAGGVLGASDSTHAGALPAGFDPRLPPTVVRAGETVSAFAEIVTAGGQEIGVCAVSQPSTSLPDATPGLVIALVLTAVWALFLSFALARGLVRPVAAITATLDRLQAGDLSARLPVEGDDDLDRLAESHNRLADALAARNRSLASVLSAIATLSPRDGVPALVGAAERAATEAFGFLGTTIVLGEDRGAEAASKEPRVPGERFRVIVPLRVRDDHVGWLLAEIPPTREWGSADADLLAIFGSQLAAAIRSAELYAETERLSEQRRDFLRGVSHDLQTPLTSIRVSAERLAAESAARGDAGGGGAGAEVRAGAEDPRLRIIVEQSERLSRLVGQLLTLSKIEAGTLRPEIDVFALGPLARRVSESLGPEGQPCVVRDRAAGWLVAADRDRVEQVLWALLDNARKYGGIGPVEVTVEVAGEHGTGSADAEAVTVWAPTDTDSVPDLVAGPRIVTTVRDHGPGVPRADRERVFERFTRLGTDATTGSGLGLSVARGLIEAMGGRIWVEDVEEGASFAFSLPAERVEDA